MANVHPYDEMKSSLTFFLKKNSFVIHELKLACHLLVKIGQVEFVDAVFLYI
jgi:hypothetical protein